MSKTYVNKTKEWRKDMLSFVNLIIIPFVSVRNYYNRIGQEVNTISLELIYVYSIFVVMNIIISHFVCSAIGILGFKIGIDSVMYTIISLFFALVLPILWDLKNKYIEIKCEITKKK